MPEFGQNISAGRTVVIRGINVAIGQIRLLFITDIPGQEMIYDIKRRESEAYVLEIPQPVTLTDYPFISKEIGITAPTAYEVAQVYLNKAAFLRNVGSILEEIRLSAILGAEQSVSNSQLEAVSVSFQQNLAQLGF